jgi:hypothetical protein
MEEPQNLNISLTFGGGEVHICMPAFAVKVEPSRATGKGARVYTSVSTPRAGKSPIEIALFPSPESFLEQFIDWIRRYRAPTPSPSPAQARPGEGERAEQDGEVEQ